jgi:S1-C subfamily serine protease
MAGRRCLGAALLPLVAALTWPAPPASAPPVVEVSTARSGVATGFETRPGRVMTVAHVLEDGGSVTVRGRRAVVLRVDRRRDLAVLGVRAAPDAAPAGHGTRLLVRRDGRTRAVAARIRRRIAASIDGSAYERPALELAADVRPGDSGAPLVGSDGRVLGVVFASSRDRAGTAYAVDLSR